MVQQEELSLLIEKEDGEQWELLIEKEEEEDLGIVFEEGLMDCYRSCRNKCIFCFIDQMPKGMRKTLYFKDDDSRLSFLQGNYITLTNMKEKDIERMIRYRLEPINISVHTTNPQLRCEMLKNRFAGEALKKIDRLFEGRILMNGQIVLCKGINDGAELERTIEDLTQYLPYFQSLSVVPVGITKYREGLHPMEPFSKEDAREVLVTIEKWQRKLHPLHGIYFVHGSDEWYLLAEKDLPEEERYDGYIQLENGVGMLRLLENEFEEAFQHISPDGKKRSLSIATGRLAYGQIRKMAKKVESKFPNTKIQVYSIRNEFFGENITVSGLITGGDLIHQLKDRDLGERLLLPCNMFRSGEEVFLDDRSKEEVASALQVKIDIVKSSGQDFLNTVLEI